MTMTIRQSIWMTCDLCYRRESDAGGVDDTDDKDDDGTAVSNVEWSSDDGSAGASRDADGRDSTLGLATATVADFAAGFE